MNKRATDWDAIAVQRFRAIRALIERECGGPPTNRNCILGQVYQLSVLDEQSLPSVSEATGQEASRGAPTSFHKSGEVPRLLESPAVDGAGQRANIAPEVRAHLMKSIAR